MRKAILILITIITVALAQNCSLSCKNCLVSFDPYSCIACSPENNGHIYFWSCQNQSPGQLDGLFIAIAVLTVLMYGFVLVMGYGVYRELFQSLQLVTLVTWRYGFQGGVEILQTTNFGVIKNNSFLDSFGIQFIVIVVIFITFWILLVLVDKIPHNNTAVLIRRKRIIFPFRLMSFFFNMLVYSGMMQVSTTDTAPNFMTFTFILGVFALTLTFFVTIGLTLICNEKLFKIDDPAYYAYLQQMVSKRWYARNNVIFSMVNRSIIIISFVLLFKRPNIAGIIMLTSQGVYTAYRLIFLRYTKLRYTIVIGAGCILTMIIVVTIYLGAISEIGSNIWLIYQTIYIIITLCLTALLFFACGAQIILRKDTIFRQLKSIVSRFILCEKTDSEIQMTKFDENSHREKVTSFRSNLLFNKEIQNNEKEIELKERQRDRNQNSF